MLGRVPGEPNPWEPAWVDWARRLQAIAQNGLEFATDDFDRVRYEQVRAVAAELAADGAAQPLGRVLDLFSADSGYVTPKVDVRGAVFRDGGILLVRESGLWTLPGGWADVEDTPREAVEREVREEAGYGVRATKLAMCLDRARHPHVPPRPWRIYKLFFRCELVSGERQPLGNETDAAEFFPASELPELDLGRVTPWQIARLFEHQADPGLPTDFD
jgi:ADP-ribose pyrophosphatase YjhB (NUDIX family)